MKMQISIYFGGMVLSALSCGIATDRNAMFFGMFMSEVFGIAFMAELIIQIDAWLKGKRDV